VLESALERKGDRVSKEKGSSFWKVFWSDMVVLGDLPNDRIQRFWNGQIVMVDPPRWKMRRFFKVIKNTNDFSKWSYCNKQPTQVKMQWFFLEMVKNTNDFSKWYKWFFKMVLL
jgi:hypothetical protein